MCIFFINFYILLLELNLILCSILKMEGIFLLHYDAVQIV